MAGGVAAAIAGALAAAAATGASGASVGQKRARVGSMTSAINSALRLTTQPLLLKTLPVSINESDEDEDDECGPNPSDVEEDSDDCGDDALASWLAGVPGSGKLWSKTQFPEGFKGAKNYELLNLSAAHDWTCPCPDQNCWSRERYPSVFTLYEFRKDAQTKSKGFRDTFRSKFLEPAYNRTTRKCTRSCRIGERNDNCIAAAGLAFGLSFSTFANARADVTKDRLHHKGRMQSRDALESKERVHLNAYIRDLRSGMEGSKGQDSTKWMTGKRSGGSPFDPSATAMPAHHSPRTTHHAPRTSHHAPLTTHHAPRTAAHILLAGKLRWHDYEKSRKSKSLPVIGSQRLFEKLWAEHTEIGCFGPCGHPVCQECGGDRGRARPAGWPNG